MAATSTRAVSSTSSSSSSSSSSIPLQYYDVFLSFRGVDTRENFTDHLYDALVRHGFSTFRDDKELETGEEIAPNLLKAIEESRLSVIVFSKNYANSRWCLEELVKIMECKTTFQHKVVPVFYHVDPSVVRSQKKSFAKAFSRHEKHYKDRGMEDRLKKWRAVLTEAANLSGWHSENVANGLESQVIWEIVKDISKKLDLKYVNLDKLPVGIRSRVQLVNSLVSLGSDNVIMVGILGIGGSGKTTIANAIYNQLRHEFKHSSLLLKVGEKSKQPNGLLGLQKELIFDILKTEGQTIMDVDRGTRFIRHRLWCRRVFVVVDDVDNCKQLNALAIERDWFRPGSRIIITTRDEALLKSRRVDRVYMPELLTYYESLQLFNRHAFSDKQPGEEHLELSREVVSYAGGNPLALKELGFFLIDKSLPHWKDALEQLRVYPNAEIQKELRISYDSLSEDYQELFLDIACFFVGMDQNYVIKILEGPRCFPVNGFEVLSHQCLLRIELGLLTMHDLIRDMGREIVRIQHRKEPGKRNRLWSHVDVLDVLTNCTGTEEVEGLVLNMPRSNDLEVEAEAFAQMNRLRLLVLNYVHVRGRYDHLSKRLRWICWFGFPLKSIPSDLPMENLVVIDMRYSSLKYVWKGRKRLDNLKILNLSHSYHLTETPNFLECTKLEMLLLNGCTKLVKVHQSIECLVKLVVLDLTSCENLRKLPLGISKLTSLQKLSLFGCSKLEKPLGFKASPSNSWFSLFLPWASPIKNPDSVNLSPAPIPGLIYTIISDLANCNSLYVPNEFESLISLDRLNCGGNNFCTLLASISHIFRLRLSRQCTKLQSLQRRPVNLEALVEWHCTYSEGKSIGSDFQQSPSLTFSGRQKVVESNITNEYRRNLLNEYRRNLLQNQDLSAIGGFKILFPGSEVPDLFIYQRVGSVLSFGVPPNRKIRGWILCVVLAGCKDELVAEEVNSFNDPLLYQVKNKTKDLIWFCPSEFDDIPGSLDSLKDHTWLHYAPLYYPKLEMEAGDEVEYSVIIADHTQFQVKKCGVDLIYEEDEKDYLPLKRYFIPDKDISKDHAVADNKIVRPSYVRVPLYMFCLLCLCVFFVCIYKYVI